MSARTGLWEPWDGNVPGPPGPKRLSAARVSPSAASIQAFLRRTLNCVGDAHRVHGISVAVRPRRVPGALELKEHGLTTFVPVERRQFQIRGPM